MLHQEMEGKGSVCNNYEMQLVRIQAELKVNTQRTRKYTYELIPFLHRKKSLESFPWRENSTGQRRS